MHDVGITDGVRRRTTFGRQLVSSARRYWRTWWYAGWYCSPFLFPFFSLGFLKGRFLVEFLEDFAGFDVDFRIDRKSPPISRLASWRRSAATDGGRQDNTLQVHFRSVNLYKEFAYRSEIE